MILSTNYYLYYQATESLICWITRYLRLCLNGIYKNSSLCLLSVILSLIFIHGHKYCRYQRCESSLYQRSIFRHMATISSLWLGTKYIITVSLFVCLSVLRVLMLCVFLRQLMSDLSFCSSFCPSPLYEFT